MFKRVIWLPSPLLATDGVAEIRTRLRNVLLLLLTNDRDDQVDQCSSMRRVIKTCYAYKVRVWLYLMGMHVSKLLGKLSPLGYL